MYSFTSVRLLSLLLLCDAQSMGPAGTILLDSIGLCENNPGGDLEFDINLQTIDSKGSKMFSMNVSSKVPLDDTIIYIINLQKWEDNGWKSGYTHTASLCSDIKKYASKLWKLFVEHTVPELPDECPAGPGDYRTENLTAVTSDLGFPIIYYGKMRMELSLSRDSKLLACVVIDTVSLRPMGPAGTILFDAIGPCENNLGADVEFDINLKTMDPKGTKMFSMNVSKKVLLDDNVIYFANLLKWEDNGWKSEQKHTAVQTKTSRSVKSMAADE